MDGQVPEILNDQTRDTAQSVNSAGQEHRSATLTISQERRGSLLRINQNPVVDEHDQVVLFIAGHIGHGALARFG